MGSSVNSKQLTTKLIACTSSSINSDDMTKKRHDFELDFGTFILTTVYKTYVVRLIQVS